MPANDTYDLFVSYSRRDNRARIEELLASIDQDFRSYASRPLQAFLDTKDILPRNYWEHDILDGLRSSRILLACISPDYLKSEYCQWEFTEFLRREVGQLQAGHGVQGLYFVPVPGWDDDRDFDRKCADWVAELRRRRHIDLRPWYDEGQHALHETAIAERLTALRDSVRRSYHLAEGFRRTPHNLEPPNPHFVGRHATMAALRRSFVTPGTVGIVSAVNGVGGLGKTALAIQYAHSHAQDYGGGRWLVRCAGKTDLGDALRDLATPLEFAFSDAERASNDLALDRVVLELRKRAQASSPARALLLLDNVDHASLVDSQVIGRFGLRTESAGNDWLHILATTHLGELDLDREGNNCISVDDLPEADALDLIQSFQRNNSFASPEERTAARDIVRRLAGFTLAIESAAIAMANPLAPITCTGFLQRLIHEGIEGLDAASATTSKKTLHREKSIKATLAPTLESLRKQPIALLALQYAALLAPEQVVLPWLRALVSERFPEITQPAAPGYPDPWDSALRTLFSLRLLQPTDAPDANGKARICRMHRVVQEVVFSGTSVENREAADAALFGLVRARNSCLKATTHWMADRWEVGPMEALAWAWDANGHPQAAWLMNQVGHWWHTLSEWALAEPLMRRALSINESSHGPDHYEVAIDLNNLAVLLQATNRFAEAESLMRRALSIDKSSYGPEHPDVARDLSNLASLLQATNRLAEAEPLMRRALSIDELSYGQAHPNVAIRLNNLAQLLQDTSRFAEAERLMRRSLLILESSGEAERSRVAVALNNLAQLLLFMNRFQEAEPLTRRALAIDESMYGADHPRVAAQLSNLAQLLKATNRLQEAEPLMRRCLMIDESNYGLDHPNVAIRLGNLAQLLAETNRFEEAEPLMLRALSIDESSYGLNHPEVAVDLNSLAFLYRVTNRYAEAEPLILRGIKILLNFSQLSGYVHPHLQTAFNNYATFLKSRGRTTSEIRTALHTLAPDFFPDPY